ncbi:hypothetical protein QTP86_032064 [Hemibagrus guttatus]|nr:hypothetical protein QTP86_032064 [Hemibagrus guttatus]
MESIPMGERVVIGADFNGHVGEQNTGDEEVMGKFGVKERDLEGQIVVDFAKRMDMAVVNTYFQKREEHRVTYKSGDLEKAYDRVPREELWYCMRKSGVTERYVRVVQDMYERSRTVVRCAVGQTEELGLHQGLALSPFLFAMVMDQLSDGVRQESPWTMMFADDIVICSESREQVEENLERWRFVLERRGMKVEALQNQLRSASAAAPSRDPPAARTLIDSGAAMNLIDGVLVEELRIPTIPCVPSLRIMAIDSQPIGGGSLTRQTELLEFQVGLFHREHLAFYVTSSPANPVILGFPWTSLVEDSASLASGHIPHVYEDFREVFSEERATHLPSHQACDCTIDLLPNASPPRGWVYPLSLPETKAMEEYIEEALAVGHIRPSTSPAAPGFFFVGKKDGGLRPCIDNRGLNAITVRYPYPLPLVPAALEQLRGAKFFTKLDLRSAYNLVRIREGDEWKTAFHTTHGHYEYLVMPFGPTNAPAVFQSLINGVFQDILGKWVIAYIDDILVYSTSLEEHVRHVREVLSRLPAASSLR